MAQPSGQVGLASGHTSEYFFYAQGSNGIWDARNSALLTKTGTAGMATEGGANVVLGNNATYYSLASAISFTGSQAYTIITKCRTSENNDKAMPFGDKASTYYFFWLNSGGGSASLRSAAGDAGFTNSSSDTMATYAFVCNGAGNLRILKNNSEVYNGSTGGAFTLSAILDGYSSGAYALTGSLEFLHVIPSALDNTTLTSYYSDPYQVLVAGATNGTSSGAPDTLDLIAPTGVGTGTAAGSTSGTGTGSLAACSLVSVAGSGAGTVAGSGTLTTAILMNNAKVPYASLSGWTLNIFNKSTGVLVLQVTGLSTDSAGRLSITNAALAAGTEYSYEPVHTTYGRRLPLGTAA